MRSAETATPPMQFAIPRLLAVGVAAVATALLIVLAVSLGPGRLEPVAVAGADRPPAPASAEATWRELSVLYRGGLQGDWEDWGWAPRELNKGQPARVNFSGWGGWILGTRRAAPRFAALQFKIQAPDTEFLEVRLRNKSGVELPAVPLTAAHRRSSAGGWEFFRVLASELDPQDVGYDQVVLRAHRRVGADWVLLDEIVLLGPPVVVSPAVGVVQGDGGPRTEPRLTPVRRVPGRVDCSAEGHLIPPAIYGIAFHPRKALSDDSVWELRAGARRWGGNPASRYNWRLGNAWNSASDWYFRNLNYTSDPGFSWKVFLDQNREHGMVTALTMPTLGWVAKDTSSYSFPVSVFGAQASTDPELPDVGNGRAKDNSLLKPGKATRTSVPFQPEDAAEWARAIQAHAGPTGARAVHFYLLDNEPMLWHSTHRDVRQEPLGYDELLSKTLGYAQALRSIDPDAYIAGPGVWGWPAYFFSARDAEAGFRLKPDRRAHGDVPLLEWYLAQLAAQEQKTGQRVIDALDVHFYPQGDGVYSGGKGETDSATAALRIRSTRALWDPTYKDESWIAERIELLPRLRRMIRDNYPGLGIVIGEYAFGGEGHISGALALAEALGRFGAFEGLSAAFYWTYPAPSSPAGQAFKAFRNYDGRGAAFPRRSLPASARDALSLFTARDDSGHVVAVVLNLSLSETLALDVTAAGCDRLVVDRQFRYRAGLPGLIEVRDEQLAIDTERWTMVLPAASISVIELHVAEPPPPPPPVP